MQTRHSANPLASVLTDVQGVSEKIGEALAKNQIVSVFDLFLHVPKSIVMQLDCPGFLYMEAGRHYVAEALVAATKISGSGHKKRFEAILEDETGRIRAIFFGPAVNYAQALLKDSTKVKVSGEVKSFLGRLQMVHPKVHVNKDVAFRSSLPTYSQVGGINSAGFKRIVDNALNFLGAHEPVEHLDQAHLRALNLSSLNDAIFAIHDISDRATNWDNRGKNPSFRRLAFEEILSFYLRLGLLRSPKQQHSAIRIETITCADLCANFLPFTLTSAQARVINEIVSDMNQDKPLTRLLQGDVGSGKTAVSAAIARHATKARLQVAVLAPTEILAEQLFHVYLDFFKNDEVRLALLTASIKAKHRRQLIEQLRCQEVDIVIGTHALLSDDVVFKRLGLIIVDEQHRFGVRQRSDLINHALSFQDFCPHLLVMSATPIPRSLALTLYGDLDLSVIDERPKGRLPIHTQILTGAIFKSLEKLCERILLTKQKAFLVFPLVEESEHLDLENAKKAVFFIKEKFGDQSALLLHGKMKAVEKTSAMAQFRDNAVSFLVATTVVEVGVDIPDATCMLIVHPERFGLAQLHQLRGRVGRKDLKSFCFLITDITNKMSAAYKRLEALCRSDNGFKLAEIDLEIRGPGELLGTRQSGLLNFVIFNYTDFADLIKPAKDYAKALVKQGLRPEHHHLFLNKEAHFS